MESSASISDKLSLNANVSNSVQLEEPKDERGRIMKVISEEFSRHDLFSEPNSQDSERVKKLKVQFKNGLTNFLATGKKREQDIHNMIEMAFYGAHVDIKTVSQFAKFNGYKVLWTPDNKNILRIFPNNGVFREASLDMIEIAMAISKLLVPTEILNNWKQLYQNELLKHLTAMVEFKKTGRKCAHVVQPLCRRLAALKHPGIQPLITRFAFLNGYKVEWEEKRDVHKIQKFSPINTLPLPTSNGKESLRINREAKELIEKLEEAFPELGTD